MKKIKIKSNPFFEKNTLDVPADVIQEKSENNNARKSVS